MNAISGGFSNNKAGLRDELILSRISRKTLTAANPEFFLEFRDAQESSLAELL